MHLHRFSPGSTPARLRYSGGAPAHRWAWGRPGGRGGVTLVDRLLTALPVRLPDRVCRVETGTGARISTTNRSTPVPGQQLGDLRHERRRFGDQPEGGNPQSRPAGQQDFVVPQRVGHRMQALQVLHTVDLDADLILVPPGIQVDAPPGPGPHTLA